MQLHTQVASRIDTYDNYDGVYEDAIVDEDVFAHVEDAAREAETDVLFADIMQAFEDLVSDDGTSNVKDFGGDYAVEA